jgi:hypothetical protein
VGPALVLCLVALTLGRRRTELALLLGVAVCLVVGVTATSEFVIRYLLPAIPLLAAAATLAAYELRRHVSDNRNLVGTP